MCSEMSRRYTASKEMGVSELLKCISVISIINSSPNIYQIHWIMVGDSTVGRWRDFKIPNICKLVEKYAFGKQVICLFRIDIIKILCQQLRILLLWKTLNGNIFNCSVSWHSKDSLGAASDLHLREKDLIAEIMICWSIFLPSSILNKEEDVLV